MESLIYNIVTYLNITYVYAAIVVIIVQLFNFISGGSLRFAFVRNRIYLLWFNAIFLILDGVMSCKHIPAASAIYMPNN